MATKTKFPRITQKYCQKLFDEHLSHLGIDPSECCSDDISPDFIKLALKNAGPDSRFKVSYDESERDGEDDSTWDLIGPAATYGHIFFDCRTDAEKVRDGLNRVLRAHFGPVVKEIEYSPESHRNKVFLDDMCCPACGRSEVFFNERTTKSTHISMLMDCGKCNAEWTANFMFHSYSDLLID